MGDLRMTPRLRALRWWHRNEDRVLITWVIVGGVVVLACLISGCAVQDVREHEEMHCAGFTHQEEAPNGQPFRYEWQQTRAASAKPWIYLSVADVDFACRTVGADPAHRLDRINGCAQWKPAGCVIYLQE